MVLELYLDLLSQPCRAVFLFAKKNEIPFELRDVSLFKDAVLGAKVPGSSGAEGGAAQTAPPQTLTLSRKVPLLKDGDFVLSEGPAILLYLARKYRVPDHWYPADAEKRAKVDEYLFWHQANMRADAPKTLWIQVLIPLFTGEPPPPASKLREVMEGLASSLAQMEDAFLRDEPFLAGDEISVADLVAVAELMQRVSVTVKGGVSMVVNGASSSASSPPGALLSVSSVAVLSSAEENRSHSRGFFQVLQKELGLAPERIMIRFYPMEPWQIGKNGTVLTFL